MRSQPSGNIVVGAACLCCVYAMGLAVSFSVGVEVASASAEDMSKNGDESVERMMVGSGFVSIELVKMPAKLEQAVELALDLFTASSDSNFRCGPNKPNPHSWLSASVICRTRLDFQLVCSDPEGAAVDTLDFLGVEPGAYRVRVATMPGINAGPYTLRYLYRGEIVDEGVVMFREPN